MHISAHVLLDVPATAFIANDTVECRTFEIGADSLGLRAPCARSSGSCVRIQTQLDSGQWLDADAVLTECRRSGDEWLWRLSFVFLREPTPLKLVSFLRHRPPRTPAPPADRPRVPTPRPIAAGAPASDPSPRAASRVRVRGISDADLRALYQAALADVENKQH